VVLATTNIEARGGSILVHKANDCLLCHHLLGLGIQACPLCKVLQASSLLTRVSKGTGSAVVAASLVITGKRRVQAKLLSKLTGLVLALRDKAILGQEGVKHGIIIKSKGRHGVC
jgi:hypothetical protein